MKFKKKAHLTAEQHPITSNPDVYTYDLTPDCDFVIMGCDGVWETKDNDEMVEWVYRRLNKLKDKSTEELKQIITELLYELVSPNHQQT